MSEHTPAIDFENLPAPSEGLVMTQFLVPAVPSLQRRPAIIAVPSSTDPDTSEQVPQQAGTRQGPD